MKPEQGDLSALMSRLFSLLHHIPFASRCIPAIGALLTIALGLFVILGWNFANALCIQVFPTLPPIQYNTALCLCMLGVGFGLVLLNQKHAGTACSVGVITLAGLTLSQYLSGWDLGIDALWMEPFVTAATVHPGRMAPATAICHLLAAGTLFLAGCRRTIALGACFLFATALCSVGASVAFGCLVNLPTTFWLGHASKMAPVTAIGVLVFGTGLAVYAWQQATRHRLLMFPWVIGSLGIALLVVTVGLWQSMILLRRADLQRVVHQQAESVVATMMADLQGRIEKIERMVNRWRLHGPVGGSEWKDASSYHVDDLEDFSALQWLNKKAELEWIVPDFGEEGLLGRNYLSNTSRRKTIQAALSQGKAYTSGVTPLSQGGKGFLIVVPVVSRQEPWDGALVAVYRIETWLDKILSKEGLSNYGIAVFQNGEQIYRREPDKTVEDTTWNEERDVTLDGLHLHLHLWPNTKLQDSMRSALPEVVLLVGLTLSTLLTWTFSLLRSVRSQSLALKKANILLTNQMQRLCITEKSLQETTRLQQAVLEGASYPIISTDANGLITSFNRAASLALGYSPEEVIKRRTPELFHDSAEIEIRARQLCDELGVPITHGFESCVVKARMQADPEVHECTFVRKDGSRFPVKLSITALRDESGKITGYVGIAYDLTQAKLAEESIHTARDAAEQANQAKSRFLANMSHEVRTPLNGILGINQMLLDSMLQPEQRLWARTLQDSAESLLTIVNDILDFSKVEAGQVELESIEFDLRKTLDQLSRLHGPKASSKGLILQTEIENDAPQRLIGDPTRLLQVLNNLVSNAIKFTDRGTINVNVGASEQIGDELLMRFEVIDRGMGMSEETCKRIFDPFAQADASTTRRFGGTGLGLSICRLLVTRMGGEISLESQLGKGSRFWFVIPFRIARKMRSVASEAFEELEGPVGRVEWSEISVLLADDSATNRLVAKHQLQKLGCKVELAENGQEALDLLAQRDFDVVLMDGQMPRMDGYEATAELRRREGEGRRTPVIALTANAMPGERERCIAIGMDNYLSKPFKAHQLEAVLTEALSSTRRMSDGN